MKLIRLPLASPRGMALTIMVKAKIAASSCGRCIFSVRSIKGFFGGGIVVSSVQCLGERFSCQCRCFQQMNGCSVAFEHLRLSSSC